MAVGVITATVHGIYNISGGQIKTAMETVNANTNGFVSGAGFYIIPLSNGTQVLLISTAIAKS